MFGIGLPELIVIMVIALVVLGPKRLPEVARTLGKAMAEFRRQSADILEEFQHEARLDEDALARRPASAAPSPVPVPGAVGKSPAWAAASRDEPGAGATAAAAPAPAGERPVTDAPLPPAAGARPSSHRA